MNDTNKTRAQLIAELRQMRKDLKQAQSAQSDHCMMKEMVSRSPISIQVLDKDGYSISVNETHTQFFGVECPPEYNMFTDPLLLEQELQGDFQMLKNGEAVFFKDTWYNTHLLNPAFPDKTVWIKTCAFPMLDPKGKPEHYVIMHENITERVRLEKEVDEKKELLESQKIWIAEMLEKEKKKFADTIHNYFGQKLSTCKNKLETLQLDEKNEAKYDKLQGVVDELQGLIITCKNLTATWRQYTEISSDFLSDMERIAGEFAENHGIQVVFERDDTLKLSSKKALLLHQILEEALTNISRYADAQQVRICLKKKGNTGVFSITDDGMGISGAQLKSKKAFGLMYMRENTDALGGHFSINKHEDKGTEIYITFPLKHIKK